MIKFSLSFSLRVLSLRQKKKKSVWQEKEMNGAVKRRHTKSSKVFLVECKRCCRRHHRSTKRCTRRGRRRRSRGSSRSLGCGWSREGGNDIRRTLRDVLTSCWIWIGVVIVAKRRQLLITQLIASTLILITGTTAPL